MGFSTFIEVNHDMASHIERDPERVGKLLAEYTRACDTDVANELEMQFGIRVWTSGSRSGWENDARAVLNQEYREALKRARAK